MFVPKKNVLLERASIETELKGSFNSMRESSRINIICLYGVSGSGKTTLANLYIKSQSPQISWEIKASTEDEIISSFRGLARKLISLKSEVEDKNENVDQLNKKALKEFVSEKLKNKNWILLYDGMDDYAKTDNWLPDGDYWGDGKVIITSCDENVETSTYKSLKLIRVNELVKGDIKILFLKIIGNNDKRIKNEQHLENLLINLPPYPLDISIAAYYLRKFKEISFDSYLNMVINCDEEFKKTEVQILKESVGDNYNKTRYRIISSSIKDIIKENAEFAKVVFFVSLISCNNILHNMLFADCLDGFTNNFIIALKKHSFLLTDEELAESNLSIHSLFQVYSLAYIRQMYQPHEIKQFIGFSINSMLKFYKKNHTIELETAHILLAHLSQILDNLSKFLNSEFEESLIKVNFMIGEIYSKYLRNHQKAKKYLDEAYALFSDNLIADDVLKLIKSELLCIMASAYLELNDFKSSPEFARKSLELSPSNKLIRVKNYYSLARSYLHNNRINKALHNLKKAQKEVEEILKNAVNDSYKLECLELKSEIYAFWGALYFKIYVNYPKAKKSINYINKSIAVLENAIEEVSTKEPEGSYFKNLKTNLSLSLARRKIVLGDAYYSLGEIKKALSDGYKPSEGIYNTLGNYTNTLLKARIAFGLGSVYLNDCPTDAIMQLDIALRYFKENGKDSYFIDLCLLRMAMAHLKLGDHDQFVSYVKEAEKQKGVVTNEISYEYAQCLYQMSIVLKDNNKEARKYAHRFIAKVKELNQSFSNLEIPENKNPYLNSLESFDIGVSEENINLSDVDDVYKRLQDEIQKLNKGAENV